MRLLELFSGSGSVGHAFRANGFEVVSLDKRPDYNPTICIDILEWDYTVYPPGHWDVVWASPECTHYSIARSKAKKPRNVEYADSLVPRALDIIEYFKPRAWYLENPASGLLKTREFMYLIPCVTVSYCKYGYPYRKNTMIWGTVMHFPWRSKCAQDCGMMVGRCHMSWAQKGGKAEWKMITLKYSYIRYLRLCAKTSYKHLSSSSAYLRMNFMFDPYHSP